MSFDALSRPRNRCSIVLAADYARLVAASSQTGEGRVSLDTPVRCVDFLSVAHAFLTPRSTVTSVAAALGLSDRVRRQSLGSTLWLPKTVSEASKVLPLATSIQPAEADKDSLLRC